jgi:hypothetical protein
MIDYEQLMLSSIDSMKLKLVKDTLTLDPKEYTKFIEVVSLHIILAFF